ncbi:hypothetical protein [Yersinia rochesterensis]|uniref:Uncharacterized protein n=1 Tax=Yersinia rochesterensis TaxID=1604335 RepID=A0A8D4SNW4_9GAMM|nr:hypothetical protein [Yersinia rochesterensis]AYD44789.1 hypothetical protein DXZ79_14460 [Yersinia rochesterensis]
MLKLHDGDASFADTFTFQGQGGAARFKPPKGKKFVVLLLGVTDKEAIEFNAEKALNKLGFYRIEGNADAE